MPLPPKVHYTTEQEYREHFERVYCRGPIMTFDGISVFFRKSDFDHCMFESSKRGGTKDRFSKGRSERIDWIRESLSNPAADLYQGWDSKRKRCDPNYRVAVAYEEFVVIIWIRRKAKGGTSANFVTAFLADKSIGKVRSMPRWVKK
jgi:hypothetical protein